MSKHTSGPWKVKRSTTPDNVGGFDWAIYAGSHILAEAYEVVDYGKTLPVEANVRLISAAPDMYEALSLLMRIMQAEDPWDRENLGSMNEACMKARAALSKAQGGENE
jgi:hypothetical protein